MLAESKFNSIETLISQALGDLDINHEEFWPRYKPWRIYYDFERKIQVLKDEVQFNKWKCRWKARNYKIKQYLIKEKTTIKKLISLPIYKQCLR